MNEANEHTRPAILRGEALRQAAPHNPVTRFAPGVTGYLHLGNIVNAIYVWGVARVLDGEVLLRLEDHDRGRFRPEFERIILDDLDWLGLEADRGRTNDFRAGATPYRQSDCGAVYTQAFELLQSRGIVYACDCSRRQIVQRSGVEHREELRYDGFCKTREHTTSLDIGWRCVMASDKEAFSDLLSGPIVQNPAEQCGDLLLRDRHGNWTYQYAVTVDDVRQGVNLVIRGTDLLRSTGRQIQLARLLGRETPPAFMHHALINDADGAKLSKRFRAADVTSMRSEGIRPATVLGQAAFRAGLLERPMTITADDLPSLFA